MIQRTLRCAAFALMPLAGSAAGAWTPQFAAPATPTGTRSEALTSYRLPIGPFADGVLPARMTEGPLNQSAWRIAAPGLTTLQLLQPLREQIAAAGYAVLYECEAAACGGFDFRYETEVLPEPDMHVDLGDYRFLAAERGTPAGPEYLSLIVSRAADQGFVQVTRVGRDALPLPGFSLSTKSPLPPGTAPQALPAAQSPAAQTPQTPAAQSPVAQTPLAAPNDPAGSTLMARLQTGGAQVLDDLVFASGSAQLTDGEYASLGELAAYLRAHPQAQVMLVGHTDASGGLEANITLSRQRAESVRARLLSAFDIPARQVQAEGVGFLAPRATNTTDAGRLANRRVEVMLITDGAT